MWGVDDGATGGSGVPNDDDYDDYDEAGDEPGDLPTSSNSTPTKHNLRARHRREWSHTNEYGQREQRLHRKPSPYKE